MQINESNVSRFLKHSAEHDCAILTAFRQIDAKGNAISKEQNNKNNDMLCKALRYLGYGVTHVRGTYLESVDKLVSENGWFAVNLKDASDFKEKIADFGEAYNQDSVLIIPKGGFIDPTKSYLYGTNHDSDGIPGALVTYHKATYARDIKFNKKSEMLTYVHNQTFCFIFGDTIAESEPNFSCSSNARICLHYFKQNFPFMASALKI